jgi:hypothetical protein
MQRDYGISLEQYREMCIAQNYRCYLCVRIRKLRVDHNHKTLAVRHLLCDGCNGWIGHLENNLSRLSKSLDYIGACGLSGGGSRCSAG